jgi:hypothetical protein
LLLLLLVLDYICPPVSTDEIQLLLRKALGAQQQHMTVFPECCIHCCLCPGVWVTTFYQVKRGTFRQVQLQSQDVLTPAGNAR